VFLLVAFDIRRIAAVKLVRPDELLSLIREQQISGLGFHRRCS
jgi:hypothetical protein